METGNVANVIDELVTHHAQAGLVDKVTRLIGEFVQNADVYNEEQAGTVDQIIARLVADVGPKDRIGIAETIADEPKAPRRVIEALANDDWIDVAAPVLTRSPCLDQDALLHIVANRGPSHMLAISRRRTIEPAVADSLAANGNKAVMRALARNEGAQLSPNGRAVLAQRERMRNQELRKAPRKPISYPARLTSEDGGAEMSCKLVDISRTGAQLTLDAPARLSGRLHLNIAGTAVSRACEPVWQDGRTVGVRFLTGGGQPGA
ncbi:DUF2336 domain-containing protein [Phreatobacter sp. HK31-P]